MIDWLEKTKGQFQLDSNCHNLVDPHQECRLSTILTEEKYLRWNSKFFGLQEFFRAAAMLASLELTALHSDQNMSFKYVKRNRICLLNMVHRKQYDLCHAHPRYKLN